MADLMQDEEERSQTARRGESYDPTGPFYLSPFIPNSSLTLKFCDE